MLPRTLCMRAHTAPLIPQVHMPIALGANLTESTHSTTHTTGAHANCVGC